MTNLNLLMEIDDMPLSGDSSIGLLRYAAKKDKSRRFNKKLAESREFNLAKVS